MSETLIARWSWIAGAIVVALSPGWATYVLTRPDVAAFARANDPASASLGAAAAHLLVSALVVAAALYALSRRHGPREAVSRLRLLVLAPLLVALFYDAEGWLSLQRPILILGCAALVASAVPRWPTVPAGVLRLVGGKRWPVALLLIATGLTAVHLGRLALFRHWAFHTRAFDLSIYDNILFNTLHGDFLACSLVKGGVHTSAHFDPILAVLVPIYALAPRAETLIVAQLLWVLSSVVPVYLIARHHLGDRVGPTLAGLALLGYPAVHGIVLSDFHSLALLAPVALWMVYFLDRGQIKAYAVAGVLVVLVREDAALFAAGVGLYAVVSGQRKLGAITIAAALLYLAVVKLAVMPDAGLLMENSEEAYPYANRYRQLIPPGGGARDGVATLLTNPSFTLMHVVQRSKMLSLLAILLPLGLLPLLAGRRLWLLAYGLAFCFLATHDWLYYPLFHYQSVLYPMLFAALPLGMLRAQAFVAAPRLQAGLLTTTILSSLTMASWVPTDLFALHTPIPHTLSAQERAAHDWLVEATRQIPADAPVSASNRVAPHLGNRRTLHVIQQQIEDEWIVVHDEDLATDDASWLRDALHHGAYETVAREHDLRVLRRSAG